MHLERAACDVLDIPRVQVFRYGEGLEHLHWWVAARPTGTTQLRGSFVVQWNSVLPPGDPAAQRADLDLVAARLVELAGGQALPGRPGGRVAGGFETGLGALLDHRQNADPRPCVRPPAKAPDP